MLSVQTRLRLARFIKAIADIETSIEITRQSLAENEGFEPQLAFKYLDTSDKNFLSDRDLKSFLNRLEIVHSHEDIKNLIKQFGLKEHSQLSYSDFERFALPATKLDLRQLAISRKRFMNGQLSNTVVWVLGRLFQKIIEGNKKLEDLRNELMNSSDWNVTDAFMAIDRRKEGALTSAIILDFLKDLQIIATYEDTRSFMRRANKDGDDKVNYREFLLLLEPKQRLEIIVGSPERKRSSNQIFLSPSLRTSNLRSPVNQDSCLTGKTFLKYQVYTPEKILVDKNLQNYLYQSPDRDQSRNSDWPKEDVRNASSSRHKRINLILEENNEISKKNFASKAFQSEAGFLKSIHAAPDTTVSAQKSKGLPYMGVSKSSRLLTSTAVADKFTPYKYNLSTVHAVFSPNRSSGIKESNPYTRAWNHDEFSRKLLLEEEISPRMKYLPSTSHQDEEYDFSGYRATLGRNQVESVERNYATSNKRDLIELASPESKVRGQEEYIVSSQKKPPIEYVLSPRRQSSPGGYVRRTSRSERSPIRGDQEEYLIKSIKEIIHLERGLEKCKTDLAFKKDFTVTSCYRKVINQNEQEGINQEQFEANLRNFGVFFTKTEASAVFERFDNDADGVISFKDFEHLVTPSSKLVTVTLCEKDPVQEIEDRTLKQFINFIKQLAEAEAQIEDIRVRVSKRFTLEDAFKAIDTKECGYIDADELRTILTYHGVFPSSADLDSLINRIDLDKDGKLSIAEFTKGFSPLKAVKEVDQEDIKEDNKEETQEDNKDEKKKEAIEDSLESKKNNSENEGIDFEERPQEQQITKNAIAEDAVARKENQELEQPNKIPIDVSLEKEEEILEDNIEEKQTIITDN